MHFYSTSDHKNDFLFMNKQLLQQASSINCFWILVQINVTSVLSQPWTFSRALFWTAIMFDQGCILGRRKRWPDNRTINKDKNRSVVIGRQCIRCRFVDRIIYLQIQLNWANWVRRHLIKTLEYWTFLCHKTGSWHDWWRLFHVTKTSSPVIIPNILYDAILK